MKSDLFAVLDKFVEQAAALDDLCVIAGPIDFSMLTL